MPPHRDTRRMIKTENLTKRFGERAVVDDVSFLVEPGTVTGFLGANGAGKTTTLRMLTGLSEPDGGEAIVLGGRYRDLPNPGRRVGVLLDAAAQHGGRRGREALAISAQLMGVEQERVAALLDVVGLDRGASRKRVRHYSLGMRQRLGIAHALLGDPEVLILDEPANGLDPPGIRWMRELLRDFADRGGTVLLSSHLLHEVQALADRVVIIDLGRIVAEGSLAELLAGSGTVVRGEDDARLGFALDAAGLDARPALDGGFVVEAQPEIVGRVALEGGVALSRLAPLDGAGLEQLFFDLTAGAANGARADRLEVAS
jgi:ABC-2 type transport system ATP-binding protein